MSQYFQAPWTRRDLKRILGITFALMILAMGLLYGFISNLELNLESPAQMIFIGFLTQWVIMIVPLLWVTKKKYGLSPEIFGLNKVKTSTIFIEVFWGYFLFIGISFLITFFIDITGIEIPGYEQQESIAQNFTANTLDLGIGILMVMLLAPFIEEIFFRGFLLRTMVNKSGIIFGTTISALIFSVLHVPWQSFIPIFILGLIINRMVLRTKSIVPAIFFHVFNNTIAFVLQILIVKEIIRFEEL